MDKKNFLLLLASGVFLVFGALMASLQYIGILLLVLCFIVGLSFFIAALYRLVNEKLYK